MRKIDSLDIALVACTAALLPLNAWALQVIWIRVLIVFPSWPALSFRDAMQFVPLGLAMAMWLDRGRPKASERWFRIVEFALCGMLFPAMVWVILAVQSFWIN